MKIRTLLLLSIFSGIFLTGCVSLKAKNAVQKQYFIPLEISTLGEQSQHTKDILEVYAPQIVPQFSGSSFVYRTSEVNYTSDYYNVFLSFPSEQIQQNSIKYIQGRKIFKYASDNIFPLKADYGLKTNVVELYADYRDPKTPRAVLSIQYALINLKNQPTVVFNKTLSASVLITEKSSNALVDGWSKGLQKILKQLVKDLARNVG